MVKNPVCQRGKAGEAEGTRIAQFYTETPVTLTLLNSRRVGQGRIKSFDGGGKTELAGPCIERARVNSSNDIGFGAPKQQRCLCSSTP